MIRRKKILFLIGSPNQTSQMHQIASRLSEYDCYFSQIYSKHPFISRAVRSGLLDHTIFSGEFKRKADAYHLLGQMVPTPGTSSLSGDEYCL